MLKSLVVSGPYRPAPLQKKKKTSWDQGFETEVPKFKSSVYH